jgi:serine/threonine protein kinase
MYICVCVCVCVSECVCRLLSLGGRPRCCIHPQLSLSLSHLSLSVSLSICRLPNSGGAAIVYKMKSRNGKGWTAVKRLVGADADARRDFHREVTIYSQLASMTNPCPYLCSLYFYCDNPAAIGLQFAENGSLQSYLDKADVSDGEKWRLTWEVTVAVACLHAEGVYHLDLKPSNILLDASRHWYVSYCVCVFVVCVCVYCSTFLGTLSLSHLPSRTVVHLCAQMVTFHV